MVYPEARSDASTNTSRVTTMTTIQSSQIDNKDSPIAETSAMKSPINPTDLSWVS